MSWNKTKVADEMEIVESETGKGIEMLSEAKHRWVEMGSKYRTKRMIDVNVH